MTVIGDGIDPVVIVCQLRKFFYAEIITVGPAKEPEKKIEPKKEEQKQQEEGLECRKKKVWDGLGHL